MLSELADAVSSWCLGVEMHMESVLYGTRRFSRSLQLDDYSCGAHSAYMIAQHFGRDVSFAEVLEEVGTTKNGTANRPLIAFFRAHGLHVRYQPTMSIGQLRCALAQDGVVIAHLDGDHVGVVHGMTQNHVYLADPSIIRMPGRSTPLAHFKKRWTRWGITVWD